jgi:hypothetical protein
VSIIVIHFLQGVRSFSYPIRCVTSLCTIRHCNLHTARCTLHTTPYTPLLTPLHLSHLPLSHHIHHIHHIHTHTHTHTDIMYKTHFLYTKIPIKPTYSTVFLPYTYTYTHTYTHTHTHTHIHTHTHTALLRAQHLLRSSAW